MKIDKKRLLSVSSLVTLAFCANAPFVSVCHAQTLRSATLASLHEERTGMPLYPDRGFEKKEESLGLSTVYPSDPPLQFAPQKVDDLELLDEALKSEGQPQLAPTAETDPAPPLPDIEEDAALSDIETETVDEPMPSFEPFATLETQRDIPLVITPQTSLPMLKEPEEEEVGPPPVPPSLSNIPASKAIVTEEEVESARAAEDEGASTAKKLLERYPESEERELSASEPAEALPPLPPLPSIGSPMLRSFVDDLPASESATNDETIDPAPEPVNVSSAEPQTASQPPPLEEESDSMDESTFFTKFLSAPVEQEQAAEEVPIETAFLGFGSDKEVKELEPVILDEEAAGFDPPPPLTDEALADAEVASPPPSEASPQMESDDQAEPEQPMQAEVPDPFAPASLEEIEQSVKPVAEAPIPAPPPLSEPVNETETVDVHTHDPEEAIERVETEETDETVSETAVDTEMDHGDEPLSATQGQTEESDEPIIASEDDVISDSEDRATAMDPPVQADVVTTTVKPLIAPENTATANESPEPDAAQDEAIEPLAEKEEATAASEMAEPETEQPSTTTPVMTPIASPPEAPALPITPIASPAANTTQTLSLPPKPLPSSTASQYSESEDYTTAASDENAATKKAKAEQPSVADKKPKDNFVHAAPGISQPPSRLSAQTRNILRNVPVGVDSPPEQDIELSNIDRFDPELEGILNDERDAEDDEVRSHQSLGVKIEVKQPALNVNVELQSAYDALLSGQTQVAIHIYKEILKEVPKHEDALFGIATTFHRIGELELARPFYGKLLSINPQHRDGLTNFLTLVAQESPEDAIAQLERLARSNPDFSPIPAQLGILYDKMGFKDKAIGAAIRAVRMSPENVAYKYNLAILYDKYGMVADATILYNQLLAAARTGLTLPADASKIQQRVIHINNKQNRG